MRNPKSDIVRIYDTSNLRVVFKACEKALLTSSFGILLGNNGLGKTTAAKQFLKHVQSESRYDAYLIHGVCVQNGGLKFETLLHEMCKVIVPGFNEPFSKTCAYNYEKAIRSCLLKLSLTEPKPRLIIIDDFGHRNAEWITPLIEQLKGKVGIIVMSTEDDFGFHGYMKGLPKYLKLAYCQGLNIYKLNRPQLFEMKMMASRLGITDHSQLIGIKTFTELKYKLKTLHNETVINNASAN